LKRNEFTEGIFLTDLSEIRDNLGTIEPLENKISAFNERLKCAETEASFLLKKYENEKYDVQKMQMEGISSFILKTIGKYEGRLEKEKQEEIQAKINYDRALADLDEIKQEKQALEIRLSSLHSLALKYESELKRRRNQIQQGLSESKGQQYQKYENEIKDTLSQITEVGEALHAAENVKLTAQRAAESLRSAESWSTAEIWLGGGIITHSIKYSHIDKAEDCFNHLSSQIETLRKELEDVRELFTSDFIHITSTQRAIDFWFDNIFTNWSVRSKVRENMDRVHLLQEQINEIEEKLNEKSNELNLHLVRMKRLQEDLLISL
jgi:hypothetical protein